MLAAVLAAAVLVLGGGSALGADPDTEAPETTITAGPPDLSGSTSAVFSFSGDDGSGSGVAGFQCKLDGASFAACPAGYTGLAQGSHTFEVRATDAAGNVDPTPASYSWVVDSVRPETTITAGPPDLSGSTSAVFSFSGDDGSGSGVAGFQCKLDGASFAACPAGYTGLAQGSHTFEVRATDAAGNVDPTPASYSWVVDSVRPETTITAGPPDLSGSTSAVFSFSGDDGSGSGVAGFQCKLDGASFAACPAGYTGLAQGSHTFEVRATDAAGNVDPTPASYSWVVDSVRPETTITAGPPSLSGSTSAVFSFSGDDGSGSGVAGFQCKLDGASFAACPAGYTGLAQGSHTFEVRATDAAGNVDPTPASYSWVVDSAGPTLNPSVNPNPVDVGGTATASAGATDVSGIASESCETPNTTTVGVKSLTCTATDNVGNTSSAIVSYTVTYRFLAFQSPIPQSTYKAGSTIPVKFALTNGAGTKISDSAAQALAAGCRVKVRLDAASPTVCATYDVGTRTFQANFKVPKGAVGANHVNVDVYAPNGALLQTETESITIKA